MAALFIFIGTSGLIFIVLIQIVEQDPYGLFLSLLFAATGGLIVAVIADELLKDFFGPDPIIEEARLKQKSEMLANDKSSSSYAGSVSSNEDSLKYAEVAQFASAVFGTDLKKPYSDSVPEFLRFVVKISISPDSIRRDSSTNSSLEPVDSDLWLTRFRYLKLCLEHLDALTAEDLELIESHSRKEIPELRKALDSKRNEELEHDLKRMGDTFSNIRRELVSGTDLDAPIDESDEDWVTQALSEVALDEDAKISMQKFLDTNLFGALPADRRQEFAKTRAKFGLWKNSIQKQDWDLIGGANSPLARKAYYDSEQQRVAEEMLAKELGEKRAKAEKLERLTQSLETFITRQMTLHKMLLDSSKAYRELTLLSARARWLHERTRPAPQPYGVSAMGAENLVADWLVYLGETGVEQTQYVGDGGVDVFTNRLCIQVKNYEKQTVSSSETRDIFGTAISEGLIACIFTSSKLSADAIDFAEKNSIIAIHYSAKLSELAALTSAGEEFLTAGEYETN